MIQPGAVFKGMPSSVNYGKGTGLEVEGTLSAVGTAGQPIIFTSIRDDTYGGDTNNDGNATSPCPGDWTRLIVGMRAALPRLSRCSSAMLAVMFTPKLRKASEMTEARSSIHNSTVEFGGGSGIRSDTNGTIDIQDSLIQNNAEHGVLYSASGSAAPVITNTSFQNNTSYAIYFSPSGDLTLDGTGLSGNTASNNGTNGLRLAGTLTGDFHAEWRPGVCLRPGGTR